MSAMVIDRINLRVPVEEVAPDELVVLLSWATAGDAAAGAAIMGPGLFHTWIVPRAESHDRVVGELLLGVLAG